MFTPLAIQYVPGNDDVRELYAIGTTRQLIAKVDLEGLAMILSHTRADIWKQKMAKDVLWEAAYYGILLHPETILDKMDELIQEAESWM